MQINEVQLIMHTYARASLLVLTYLENAEFRILATEMSLIIKHAFMLNIVQEKPCASARNINKEIKLDVCVCESKVLSNSK